MNSLIGYALLLAILGRCSPKQPVQRAAAPPQQEVYLYVNNLSFQDTLAPVRVVIDDSLYMQQALPHAATGSTFYKMIRLGRGTHQFGIHFGPFQHDTTLTIGANISLFIDLHHFGGGQQLVLTPDGIQVSSIVQDGHPAID
jgi:hypothetical protein